MQCPDCGAFVTQEDQFCGECGRPLLGKTAPAKPLSPLEAKDLPTVDVRSPMPPPSSARVALTPRKPPAVPVLMVTGLALLLALLCGIGVLFWLVFTEEKQEDQPVQGTLIYEDDFEDAASGWDVYSEDNTWAGYLNGEYRLAIYRDNYVTWGNPENDQGFTDFQIEVDAHQVEGPLDNSLGLLVRYQPDDENFYRFKISSDGYYSADLLRADQWVNLISWEESDAINEGLGATNHLTVVCSGNRFSFYVNGIHLIDMTDNAFGSGNIGLVAGAFEEAGVVVHFDNLKVYSLQE